MSEIIDDPESIEEYSRILRCQIGRYPDIKAAEFGVALTQLLLKPIGDVEITIFTGRPVTRESLTKWYLLTTMAIGGHGFVNPDWINTVGELPPTTYSLNLLNELS